MIRLRSAPSATLGRLLLGLLLVAGPVLSALARPCSGRPAGDDGGPAAEHRALLDGEDRLWSPGTCLGGASVSVGPVWTDERSREDDRREDERSGSIRAAASGEGLDRAVRPAHRGQTERSGGPRRTVVLQI
jgi:hypothetical protein